MTTTSLIRALRRGWWLIVALVAVGGAAGAGISFLMTPQYESSSRIFVAFDVAASTDPGQLVQANNFAIQKVYSYTQVVTSPRVLQVVIDDLGLDESATELAYDVAVEVPTNSTVMKITATAGSPEDAATLVSTVVNAFEQVVVQIETPTGGGTAPVRIESLEDATAPTGPSSPNIAVNIVLGAFTGLAIGLIIVGIIAATDRRIRRAGDVADVSEVGGESLVLGSVPRYTRDDAVTVLRERPGSPVAEAYRTIAAGLSHGQRAMPRVLAVAPCVPPESASPLAMNLGLAFAEFGVRVVVVDANLRTGWISDSLELTGRPGTVQALEGTPIDQLVVSPGGLPVGVLPAGRLSGSPAGLFASTRLPAVIRDLRASYDLVIIDAPPVLPLSDALSLADVADGAVLALTSGRVSDDEYTSAMQSLESIGTDVLGVVVTDAQVRGIDADPAVAAFRDLRTRA